MAVLITHPLQGCSWRQIADSLDCKFTFYDSWAISAEHLKSRLKGPCIGIIAHSNELWDETTFSAASATGAKFVVFVSECPAKIDTETAKSYGIHVETTRGLYPESISEAAFALALAAARRIVAADQHVRAGKFKVSAKMLFLGERLRGACCAVIGTGPVACAVARRLLTTSFGRVLYVADRAAPELESFAAAFGTFAFGAAASARRATLKEALNAADVIVVESQLTQDGSPRTISAEDLAHLRNGAVFVSIADHGAVDLDALVELLKERASINAGVAISGSDIGESVEKLGRLENVSLWLHGWACEDLQRENIAASAIARAGALIIDLSTR